MTYSTRRLSAQDSVPIPIRASASPSAPSPLSSSAGKSRRPPSASSTRRRLSNSTTTLRPGIAISHSLPAPLAHPHPARARSDSATIAPANDDEDDGEVKGAALAKAKGQLYECEKCSKVYRHSTCLVKHRWEHTAHWKEASKLLLSKHQQVQLLEAAAILKAAASGSSLPEEKSYWPAAVSPPSSGLLGSHSLNINVLSSPRQHASLSPSLESPSLQSPLPQSYTTSERDLSPPEEALDEGDEDEEVESVSTGDDLLTEGMFDMDLDEQPLDGRARSADSGYNSLTRGPGQGPFLGFFDGRQAVAAVV